MKMGDPQYEKEYLSRKKKLRKYYKELPKTKKNQETFHRLMGPGGEENHSEDEISLEED
jgi:hypothetical protein